MHFTAAGPSAFLKGVLAGLLAALITPPTLPAQSGPYPPAAGQPGSTAIPHDHPGIIGWATAWRDYQPHSAVATTWRTPHNALGNSTGDVYDIVCLGDRGQITLLFDGVITDGPGWDFAVFENSFSDTFLELAYVEVSSDGVNFFRFPNRSLTPSPVPGFGTLDPTNINNLAGKYRKGFGTPFDLSELPNHPSLNKNAVRFVRLVDVCGDGNDLDSFGNPIYDPHPTSGSPGFDLEAVAVLNGIPSTTWKSFRLPDFATDVPYLSPAWAALPDGRFLLAQGRHYSSPALRFRLQNVFGHAKTSPLSASWSMDPSFLAVRNATTVLIGEGDWAASPVGTFNPLEPSGNLVFTPLATVQNYAATWWQNPAPGGSQGWLIAGTIPPSNNSGLRYLSADGSVNTVVVVDFSTYTGGLAVDAAGNVYMATYELSPPTDEVYRYSPVQIEAAIASQTPLTKAQGQFLFDFQSAGSLAVDSLGRVWAAGWNLNGYIQAFNPATGASAFIAPQHPPLANATSTSYQIRTATVNSTEYLILLARDPFETSREAYALQVPVSALEVSHTWLSWRQHFFGANATDSSQEASLWGAHADPDADGLPNLIEYALGSDPLSPASRPQTLPDVVPLSSQQRLTLTFTPHVINGLTYVVQASNDLLNWTEQTNVTASLTPDQPFTFTDSADLTTTPRRFLRLHISLNP